MIIEIVGGADDGNEFELPALNPQHLAESKTGGPFMARVLCKCQNHHLFIPLHWIGERNRHTGAWQCRPAVVS